MKIAFYFFAVFLLNVCGAAAQTSRGLTTFQLEELQHYASCRGLKLDFSRASADTLSYDRVKQSIDSIALLPEVVLTEFDLLERDDGEHYLLMQSLRFVNDSAFVTRKWDSHVDAFLFRTYLVTDTTNIFDYLPSEEVVREMQIARVLQSWPASEVMDEYTGRGLNPYRQDIVKVVSRLLGDDFKGTEPKEDKIDFTYLSQPLSFLTDNPSRIRRENSEKASVSPISEVSDGDVTEIHVNKEIGRHRVVNSSESFTSVDYSLKEVKWIVLTDISGNFALLFLTNDMLRLKIPKSFSRPARS